MNRTHALSKESSNREFARHYAKVHQLPVLALHWIKANGTCSCGSGKRAGEVCSGSWKAAKHPLPEFPHAKDSATLDLDLIARVWTRHPKAGIACGIPHGHRVLDFDDRNGGTATHQFLRALLGDLPRTSGYTTGTDPASFHRWFTTESESNLARLDGLDVLEAGKQFVVVPPSVTSRRYSSEHGGCFLCETSLAADTSVCHLLRKDAEAKLRHGLKEFQRCLAARKDARTSDDREVFDFLCQLRDGVLVRGVRDGFCQEEARGFGPLLVDLWYPVTDAYTLSMFTRTLDSVFSREPRNPKRAPRDGATGPFHRTDVGNARRFVDSWSERVRYSYEWHSWLIYDGTRWARDESGEVERLAKDTIESIFREALTHPAESNERQTLTKHALASQSAARIRSMIAMAESEPGIAVAIKDLDADPMLLNVRNGTIDLRTGTLRPHRPEDLMTKLAPVEFDREAKSPLWLSFLDRVMDGNAELTAFLQRALGYSLTALTREQCLLILFGGGRNGKSTLVGAVRAVLGEYAEACPPEALMVHRNSGGCGPTPEIARLRGARFVAASESEAGQRLAESRIKQLTGGDPIVARFLHGQPFEFIPAFKLFLSVNHKPEIRGTDEAIWRRIRLIPFDVTIPENERDHELPEKLKAETPGILKWAVEGCLDWQRRGLDAPEEVKAATRAYRLDEDLIEAFIRDSCVRDPKAKTTFKDLWDAYIDWTKTSHIEPISRKALADRFTEMGFPAPFGHQRTATRRGIRLAPSVTMIIDDDELPDEVIEEKVASPSSVS